mmetsp:Transcript_10121/g.33195  ORF Transcript_10121/g.33195 Transcript_10121/m.33195 type:complete len:148 (+) Transcript_10121:723-1166(+)
MVRRVLPTRQGSSFIVPPEMGGSSKDPRNRGSFGPAIDASAAGTISLEARAYIFGVAVMTNALAVSLMENPKSSLSKLLKLDETPKQLALRLSQEGRKSSRRWEEGVICCNKEILSFVCSHSGQGFGYATGSGGGTSTADKPFLVAK